MAQVQIRDAQGQPITSVAVRLATDGQDSTHAYDERFTDLAGNTAFPAPAHGDSYMLHVNYTDDCCGRGLRQQYDAQSVATPTLDNDIRIVLVRSGSGGGTPPFPPEVGALRVEGARFVREDGSTFQWRGATQFLTHARFMRGESIQPQIDWSRALGVNSWRVFMRIGWGGEWLFYSTPERDPNYVPSVREFFHLTAAAGIRVQAVALTERRSNARELVQQLFDIAREFPTVTVQIGNEPHVNGIDTRDAISGVNRHGVLSCAGDYLVINDNGEVGDGVMPSPPHSTMPHLLDYGDLHTERSWHEPPIPSDRYPRNGKEPVEFVWETKKVWIDGEPLGIAERMKTGSGARTTDINQVIAHHATATLLTGGSCIHSQAGLEGRAPDPVTEPVQTRICEAIGDLWSFIDEDTYTGRYSAPHISGFPVVWEVRDSLVGHAYASLFADHGFACNPLPQGGWTAVGRDGWNVVDQLEGFPGVVKVVRAREWLTTRHPRRPR